jgi:hypothetical protein
MYISISYSPAATLPYRTGKCCSRTWQVPYCVHYLQVLCPPYLTSAEVPSCPGRPDPLPLWRFQQLRLQVVLSSAIHFKMSSLYLITLLRICFLLLCCMLISLFRLFDMLRLKLLVLFLESILFIYSILWFTFVAGNFRHRKLYPKIIFVKCMLKQVFSLSVIYVVCV